MIKVSKNLIFIALALFMCFSCGKFEQSDVILFEEFWLKQEGVESIMVKEGSIVDTIDIKIEQTSKTNVKKLTSLPAFTYNRMLEKRASYNHDKEIMIRTNRNANPIIKKYPVTMLESVDSYLSLFLNSYESIKSKIAEIDSVVFQGMAKMDTSCLVLDNFRQENKDIILELKCFSEDSVSKNSLEVTFNSQTNGLKGVYLLK